MAKNAEVNVTSFAPGTKLELYEKAGDYFAPDALGDVAKSGTVDKDGTLTIKGLQEGTRYWVVPADKKGKEGNDVEYVTSTAKPKPEGKDQSKQRQELAAQARATPNIGRQVITGARSTLDQAPTPTSVGGAPAPIREQTILEGGKGQDFGTRDYEQAERTRYAGLSDLPPHEQRPGGSSEGDENPSYSGAKVWEDGKEIKQRWGGDGASVHRTSSGESTVVVPTDDDDEAQEPKYPQEAKTRSSRQSDEEQAKPGSSTALSDPTIDTPGIKTSKNQPPAGVPTPDDELSDAERKRRDKETDAAGNVIAPAEPMKASDRESRRGDAVAEPAPKRKSSKPKKSKAKASGPKPEDKPDEKDKGLFGRIPGR